MRTIEEIESNIERYKNRLGNNDFNHDEAYAYMVHWQDELRAALTVNIPLDRLREICNAEHSGMFFIPPCNVGDIVYDISDGTPYATEVLSFTFVAGKWSCRTVSGYPNVSEFGKRIFLTEHEANAALKQQRLDELQAKFGEWLIKHGKSTYGLRRIPVIKENNIEYVDAMATRLIPTPDDWATFCKETGVDIHGMSIS